MLSNLVLCIIVSVSYLSAVINICQKKLKKGRVSFGSHFEDTVHGGIKAGRQEAGKACHIAFIIGK